MALAVHKGVGVMTEAERAKWEALRCRPPKPEQGDLLSAMNGAPADLQADEQPKGKPKKPPRRSRAAAKGGGFVNGWKVMMAEIGRASRTRLSLATPGGGSVPARGEYPARRLGPDLCSAERKRHRSPQRRTVTISLWTRPLVIRRAMPPGCTPGRRRLPRG